MEFEGCSCMGQSLDHFLQPTVLMILNRHEMHGFALIKEIGDSPLFHGNLPDPSGLYRYLKKMEQQGTLVSREEVQKDFPSKRIYTITEHGKKCLVNWSQTIQNYCQELAQFSELLEQEARRI